MAHRDQNTTLKIENLRLPAINSGDLKEHAARRLGVSQSEVSGLKILRRSTDARQRRVDFVYTVIVTVAAAPRMIDKMLQQPGVTEYRPQSDAVAARPSRVSHQPVIIGCGPAGLFAALTLLERGLRPILVERGERITQRSRRVAAFWDRGLFHPQSNVLFGEGGAGTFSDGKLTTRIKSPFREKVLQTFVEYGAPDEILYLHKPHVGSDRIRSVIPAMVDDLRRRGVEFRFSTTVTDVEIIRGSVRGVVAGDRIPAQHIFLATGHSARDVYRMLRMKGFQFRRKGFAIGLRIEHPQELINRTMVRSARPDPRLLPASYMLTYHDAKTGRGVYSFCMCPGGKVIACADDPEGLCTNGMSTYLRDGDRANAALVVTVREDDCDGADPLSGVDLQIALERQAFIAGGGGFRAPAQRASDFLAPENVFRASGTVTSSYGPGVTEADLRTLLPAWIREPLQRALRVFDGKIPGFIAEGVLVGVETRTSAPLRIARDPETFHAVGIHGLIPIGEGSGYAGGIVSSAVDGVTAALAFDRKDAS